MLSYKCLSVTDNYSNSAIGCHMECDACVPFWSIVYVFCNTVFFDHRVYTLFIGDFVCYFIAQYFVFFMQRNSEENVQKIIKTLAWNKT